MIRTSLRRALVPGLAALTLLVSACGADNETTSDGGDGGDAPESSSGLSGTLNGAGATSQEKAQEAWRTTVQGLNGGNLVINYKGVGSTDGRQQFIDASVDFAGTDSYLKDDEVAAAKERCGGTDPIEVPAYVSSIAVFFNLGGDITSLNLKPDVVADIFNNKITKWNDPRIVEDNPDASLPDAEISAVHRSDESGTTKNFTDYLGKVAPEQWPYEAEDAFPGTTGGNPQAAQGTSGVVDLVKGTENTIGYADVSQVGDLGQVSIQVGNEFVAPSAEAAAKTVEVSSRVEGRSDVDLATDVDRTTTEAGAYPVILLSYLVACQQYDDPEVAKNVKGYLAYTVSTEGQDLAAEEVGAAKLSDSVATEAQAAIDTIKTD